MLTFCYVAGACTHYTHSRSSLLFCRSFPSRVLGTTCNLQRQSQRCGTILMRMRRRQSPSCSLNPDFPLLISSHLFSSLLISPHLSSSLLISPHLSSSLLISPHLSSSLLISPHLSSSLLISPHLSSSLLISPHLSSPLLTSPPLPSPQDVTSPWPLLLGPNASINAVRVGHFSQPSDEGVPACRWSLKGCPQKQTS